MPSLTTIPLEILAQVTTYIGPGLTISTRVGSNEYLISETANDFGALRLTCKHIEVSLFETFARRQFDHVSFSRAQPSLRAFIDISKSRFSPYIRHVTINSEIIPMLDAPDQESRADESDSETETVGVARIVGAAEYQKQRADQKVFLNTGMDQYMLCEAFCHLGNLERVRILSPRAVPYFRDDFGLRDYHWQERIEQTSNASCMQNVLFSLGRTKTKLKHLQINMETCLCDDAFNIPSFMRKSVVPILANLEALEIELPDAYDGVVIHSEERKLHQINHYYIRKFLSQATEIKHLCLTHLYGSLLNWLSGRVTHQRYQGPRGLNPPAPPTFKNLSKLTLGDCCFPANDLCRVIQKFSATLRKLHLYKYVELMMSTSDEWPKFVAQLARASRHVEEVTFHNIRLREVRKVPRKIIFKDSKNCFYYAGSNMEEVLGELVDTTTIAPPES
ncbi:hypothetical protein GGR53DRAFT_481647 [Hypoxylon sp. FL1150]|nr:hypothetical protein GGR53DRAFT_481647 [Hypoxylon sp. FL1150]